MEKIYLRWKLIVGENSSSGKKIRHLNKISSLFPDEVFSGDQETSLPFYQVQQLES